MADSVGRPKHVVEKAKPKGADMKRLRELNAGELILETPNDYSGEVRMPRKLGCGEYRRRGVLSDGFLLIYKTKQKEEEGHVWRKVDLGTGYVKHNETAEIVIGSDKKYTMRVPASEMAQWLENLLAHRLYRKSILKIHQPSALVETPDAAIASAEDSGETTDFVSRKNLPRPMAERPSLFKLLFGAIGKDLSTMSLPAAMMEPLGTLQVLCEQMQYCALIDEAVHQRDATLRLMRVAAFAISQYASTAERVRKPFQSLLGETFEYCHPSGNWRFVAEAVQRRPATAACHVDGNGWQYAQTIGLKSSLTASGVDITPLGSSRLHLDAWKETYEYTKVRSKIHGVLRGQSVLDHFGDCQVSCLERQLVCNLVFEKMTKSARGHVSGVLKDKSGAVLGNIDGNWTNSVFIKLPDSKAWTRVWHRDPLPGDHERFYGMTTFAIGLNELQPGMTETLPPTDSRLRPDQRALENGDVKEADVTKKRLEQQQRENVQALRPIWFTESGSGTWKFNGPYWKKKEESFKGMKFPKLW